MPAGCVSWDEFIARGDEIDAATADARADAVQPDDLCDILFTSGTTGRPKGAMLFHSASVRAYDAWSDVVGLRTGDRYLIINPFFHTFGLKAGILACVLKGATIVPHPVFDVPAVMRRIVEERISMLPGPPAIFQTILNHPNLDEFDFSTLRLSVTGSATIPVEMIVDMREELGFENVVTGYGLTERTGSPPCAGTTTTPKPSPRPRDGRSPTSRSIVDESGRSSPPASRARSSCAGTT